jgi:hypothetical protein
MIDMVEERTKAVVKSQYCCLAKSNEGIDWNDIIPSTLLLLPENPIIDLPLLELIHLRLKLLEIDRLTVKTLCLVIVSIENRTLKQETQTRRFRNSNALRTICLSDPIRMAARANNHRSHGDHLANLVHHETLSMDLQTEPFCAIDDNRRSVHLK